MEIPMFLNNTFLFALLAALIATTACTTRQTTVRAEAPPRQAAVETVAAASSNWETGSDAVGTVRARTSAVLSSKVMGYMREVRVRAGDTVRAGQVVAVLDSRDLEVACRQAQAARDEVHDAQT